jgi:type II secretory pathway component PulK
MKPLHAQRGVALVTAMLIAALVTAAVVALATHQSLESRRISNVLGADREALLLAELEIRAAERLVADLRAGNTDDTGEDWAREPLRVTRGETRITGRLQDLLGRFNLTNLSPDPAIGMGTSEQPPPDAAGTDAGGDPPPMEDPASLSMTPDGPEEVVGETAEPLGDAANEEGRVATGDPAGNRPGLEPPMPPAQRAEQQFRSLLKALELDETPVQAILDWIDPDNETRFPNGAEDDYYSRQTPAYRTSNRPLASVRELLLVRGVDAAFVERLGPFVTCLPTATPVNVNTASREVLMSLDPGISSGMARLLVQARETQPFTDAAAFMRHPLLQYRRLDAEGLAFASQYFLLESEIVTRDQERAFESTLTRANRQASVLDRRQRVMDAPEFLESEP